MSDENEKKIFMKISFDNENHDFYMGCYEGASEHDLTDEKKLFEFCLSPNAFHNLASDMMRISKEYNLMQAEKYQESNDENRTRVENRETASIGFEGSPDQSENTQQKGCCGSC